MSELSILTKKKVVTFQEEEGKKREITLYPFGFQYFNEAIAIINKYYECYRQVAQDYKQQVQAIYDSDLEEKKRELKLKRLDNNFDEIGSIVQNIMNTQDSQLGDNIGKMIGFCCREEVNLNQFHWGEVGALLAAAIEVNMDFFEQNAQKIPLLKTEKIKPKEKEKTGDTSSAS
ncbi:MAG: hypothetical protein QNJ55_15705 [Xenococcus sp. MO_188.B8]|nr:hypothetical protein [Xenococcus sp. MO_188.B8]